MTKGIKRRPQNGDSLLKDVNHRAYSENAIGVLWRPETWVDMRGQPFSYKITLV